MRKRLSKKQLWFLNNVFEAGEPVTDALRNLHIRPGTLDRWLTKPIFLNRLRMYLNQYYLQARMELARSAPMAVSGLSFLSEKSLRHGEVRKACNDLLNLHTQYAKLSPCQGPLPRRGEGVKKAQDGAKPDKNGVLLEQFGVVLDNNGVILDKVGSNNEPQNAIFNTKNNENIKFPRLIPSK